MNLFKLAAPLALALAFAACTDGDTGTDDTADETGTDTEDTAIEFNDDPPTITDATYDCGTTTANTWTYGVRTAGWADAGASLNIYQTGAYANGTYNGWTELGHEFSQGDVPGTDFAEDGEWDQWGVALAVTDKTSDIAPGTALKTLYSCDLYDAAAGPKDLAWRLYVYDDDDNDPNTDGVANDCWDFGFQTNEIPLIGEADALCTAQE